MRFFGNVIWFLFGGFVEAAVWFFTGLAFFASIIFIPFGFQAFKLARLSLAPFGKTVTTEIAKHPFANVIWNLLGAFGFVVATWIVGLVLCITIVGIPFGKQCFKLAKVAFAPFGSTVAKK